MQQDVKNCAAVGGRWQTSALVSYFSLLQNYYKEALEVKNLASIDSLDYVECQESNNRLNRKRSKWNMAQNKNRPLDRC